MNIKIFQFLLIFFFFSSCSSYEEYKNNLNAYEDPNLFHESMQKLTDVSKLHSLGWQHKMKIQEGIKNMYTSYLSV